MRKEQRKSLFLCRECGNESPKWSGQCPYCQAWNSLEEVAPETLRPSRGWLAPAYAQPLELSRVSRQEEQRIPLPFGEMNRVLGGGIVPGSLVLMAGEPGVGKSTLLLQVAAGVATPERRVLYISGEESPRQVKMRAERLGLSGQGLLFLPETDVDEVLRQLEEISPALVVVDSIQTLYTQEAPSGPGSVPQVRECTRRLMQWAKAKGTPVLITGHVTKDGTLAGPRVLEHMVDVVLYLEGEALSAFRILKSVKNRFGSTNEVGVFQMAGRGLEEVEDPSRLFLSQRQEGAVGSAVFPSLEGTRPLLVEVQALTTPTILGTPRRIANGVDYNRLLLIIAVLTKHMGLPLSGQDVVVNVVGGIRLEEPAADLPISLAIASSFHSAPLNPGLIALGEVGLNGELRPVPQLDRRLREAARLGFSACLLPAASRGSAGGQADMQLLFACTVQEALRLALPRRRGGKEAPGDSLERVLAGDREAARIAARALEVEQASSHNPHYLGWEWFEVQASTAKLREMVIKGIVKVSFKSNSATCYRLVDPVRVREALASIPEEGGEEPL